MGPSGSRTRASAARRSVWRENLESLAWAAVLALVIRTFIIAPFKIPSGSMHPTLLEGDRILVNKFLYRFREPERGDIIVFRYPDDTRRPFIKRLVGRGGDTVEIREGRVLVNGIPLADRPIFEVRRYVNQGEYGRPGEAFTVPEGALFVLGDNSSSSHDSRFWGTVPRAHLIGKAVCIFWPPQRLRRLQ